MRIESDDFLVIKDENERRKLVKVKHAGSIIKAIVSDRNAGSNPERINLDQEDVLANLGSNPQPFMYAGVRGEPWFKTWRAEGWGKVHEFRDVPKAERKVLTKHLARSLKNLQRYKLDTFLPIELEVRPKRGKWAGFYHYTPNDIDTLVFHTDSLVTEPTYIIMHEAGHGVWYRLMTANQRARWIKLYHSSVTRKELLTKRIQSIGKAFVKSFATVDIYRKEFEVDEDGENDDLDLFDECIAWIGSVHHLNKKHLDLLVEAGDQKAIAHLWPDRDITTSDIDPLVSEYGEKSPEEFFSEAFSFYFTKKILPKSVKKLLRRTLHELRGDKHRK